jgi:eukaryotic-like serine/threonine-protein kinase
MAEASDPMTDVLGVAQAGSEGMPKRFGKYTLLRRLATGGMAELFLALQKSVAGFEKIIVIKRILPSMNTDQAFIDMLLHEARIAATLSHPNIVQIYDVGFAEGAYYIAMEHIHGEDLRSIVRQMKKLRLSEFPLEHALAIVNGICAGLAYAHEKRGLDGEPLRIVHRDISPQNVVATYGGDIKVVDFGIAKSGDRIGEDTKSGRLKGKVPYMSPEQARGEEIDWRSDIFAVGIILFELTTGKRLFKGRNELETLRLICDRTYPTPGSVRAGYPPRLERIVMKALAKDREQRYQTAREMQSDLESYIRDERVAVSTIQLRGWMQTLYVDKLAQQKEALHDIKQLADVIAAQNLTEFGGDEGVDSTTTTTGNSIVPSMSGASHTVSGTKSSTGKTLAAVGAVVTGMAFVAMGAYMFVRRDAPPPAAAVTVVSASGGSNSHVPVEVEQGSVELVTHPAGAAIWINGALRAEKTPAEIDKLPRGTPIDVKVTMEGFAPVREQVTLTADAPKVRIERDLVAGTVTVVVKTNAPGAQLFIDNKSYEALRVEGLAADEEHKLVVAANGYKARTARFRSGPNETKELEINLERDDAAGKDDKAGGAKKVATPVAVGKGKLNVGSRGGFCNVSVGGRGYGSTPVGGIELPAGNHVVGCKPASGPAQSMGVTIQPDKTSRISFTLGG